MRIFNRHKKVNPSKREEIYLTHVEKVYTLCRRYSSCNQKAKDFTQDCFVEIFKNFHRYDSTKGELGAWIYIVSRNHVLKKLEKEKRMRVVYVEDQSYFEGADDGEYSEDKYGISPEVLLEAIQELPEGYRMVLNLFVFEKKSHKEIAEVMGISASTSRSQLARAKNYLKKTLQESSSYAKQGYGR